MLTGLTNWLSPSSELNQHSACSLWDSGLIWTHVLSDIASGLAALSIGIVLFLVAQQRRNPIFRRVLWLFAAFSLLNAGSQRVDVLALWGPTHGLEALVQALTATASVGTAIALWWLVPRAFPLASTDQLREADAAWREREACHRARLERSLVPLHTLDTDGVITGVSDSWLALFGYRREEVIGQHLSTFHAPGSNVWTDADRAKLTAEGEVQELERRWLRCDGAIVETLVSARLERQGPVTWINCVLVDVTARRQAEAAFRTSDANLWQAQKMEAIGHLTGGIAHDFNNILTAVTGNLDLIRSRLCDDRPELERFAADARDAAAKAAGLTAQLLSFSRQPVSPESPSDPSDAAPASRLPTGETVLLVEDDEVVRATLAAILEDLGYHALEAENADAGLAILAATPVHVVLTDLSMPGSLDGLGLAEHARVRFPGLPLVLATGHIDPLRERELPTGMQLLQKPCSPAQLATALRHALDRPKTALPA
jgi:PAS domain S-box-containing protein